MDFITSSVFLLLGLIIVCCFIAKRYNSIYALICFCFFVIAILNVSQKKVNDEVEVTLELFNASISYFNDVLVMNLIKVLEKFKIYKNTNYNDSISYLFNRTLILFIISTIISIILRKIKRIKYLKLKRQVSNLENI